MSAARRASARLSLSLPIATLLAATPAAARAQDAAPAVAVTLDGGMVAAHGTDGPPADAVPARVTWLAGLTARTRPARLGRAWRFNAVFALRREPVFAMARTSSSVAPAYLDALIASSSIEFAHASGEFDTAVIGRFAETRLDRAQAVTRAENTIGDWAFLVDAVVDLRWYGRHRAPRGEHSALDSLVHAYAGVQHNQRLHRAGDLQPFDDPTGRIVAGVSATAWRWRHVRGANTIAAGGGVDFEAAIRPGERLPGGFRVLVRAEIDPRRAAAARR